jgi:hypothetical protein
MDLRSFQETIKQHHLLLLLNSFVLGTKSHETATKFETKAQKLKPEKTESVRFSCFASEGFFFMFSFSLSAIVIISEALKLHIISAPLLSFLRRTTLFVPRKCTMRSEF